MLGLWLMQRRNVFDEMLAHALTQNLDPASRQGGLPGPPRPPHSRKQPPSSPQDRPQHAPSETLAQAQHGRQSMSGTVPRKAGPLNPTSLQPSSSGPQRNGAGSTWGPPPQVTTSAASRRQPGGIARASKAPADVAAWQSRPSRGMRSRCNRQRGRRSTSASRTRPRPGLPACGESSSAATACGAAHNSRAPLEYVREGLNNAAHDVERLLPAQWAGVSAAALAPGSCSEIALTQAGPVPGQPCASSTEAGAPAAAALSGTGPQRRTGSAHDTPQRCTAAASPAVSVRRAQGGSSLKLIIDLEATFETGSEASPPPSPTAPSLGAAPHAAGWTVSHLIPRSPAAGKPALEQAPRRPAATGEPPSSSGSVIPLSLWFVGSIGPLASWLRQQHRKHC